MSRRWSLKRLRPGDPTYAELEREAEGVVKQRDDAWERLVRIRAAAMSDADLAALPALRDFLLRETDRVEGYPWALIGLVPVAEEEEPRS